MVCAGCGKEIPWYASHNRCPKCYPIYEYMIDHPTDRMKKLLGDNTIFFRYEEDFLPLVAIQEEKMEGKIGAAKASERTDTEWDRIRKELNPTPEEFEKRRREIMAKRSSAPPSVYDDLLK